MKNVLTVLACLSLFSTVHAASLTCTSSQNSDLVAKISSSRAELSHQGDTFSTMYLRQGSKNSMVYKSIGEFATALKVSMNFKTGKTQAEVYHVTKGGTRLAYVLDLCR